MQTAVRERAENSTNSALNTGLGTLDGLANRRNFTASVTSEANGSGRRGLACKAPSFTTLDMLFVATEGLGHGHERRAHISIAHKRINV